MNPARTIAFLFNRFFVSLLMISLSFGVPPAYALRPMLNQAGLEQDLRQAGMEEGEDSEESALMKFSLICLAQYAKRSSQL